MELYILFGTIILFLVYIHNREQQFTEERQDLLDRLMAKDITEYKELTSEPVNYEPVAVTEEKEYWMEIEEQKR